MANRTAVHQIQRLVGIHRNPVEGVSDAPDLVRGSFTRAGGLSHPGSRAQYLTGVTLSSTPPLMYDEEGVAYFANGTVWNGHDVLMSMSGAFTGRVPTLAPRNSLHVPWSRSTGGELVDGGAIVRGPGGNLFTPGVAPTVTPATIAGAGDVGAATYRFLVLFDAASEGGLVTYAARHVEHTVGTTSLAVELTVGGVLPLGYVVRFYWRPLDQLFFETLAVRASNGVDPLVVSLTSDQYFAASPDVLMRFQSGRAELHQRRFWGAVQGTPYVMLTQDAMTRVNEFEVGSVNDATDQFSALRITGFTSDILGPSTVSGTTAVRMGIDIKRLEWRRYATNTLSSFPLLSARETLNSGSREIGLWIRYHSDSELGYFVITWRYSTGGPVYAASVYSSLLPGLALAQGSTAFIEDTEVWWHLQQTVNGAEEWWISWRSKGSASFSTSVLYLASGNPTYPSGWTGQTMLVRPRAGGIVTDFVFTRFLTSLRSHESVAVAAANPRRFALPEDANPAVSSENFTSSDSFSTVWTRPTQFVIPTVAQASPSQDFIATPDLTLGWSNHNHANLGTLDNYTSIEALTSSSITALTSTPAGLLVFCENETFLVRGDPALSDFSVQRFSGTLGCDEGVIPARLGSVVFPIYKGEIYSINLGMGDVDFGGGVENVSRPVWLPTNPFTQVVGEPGRNHLVAQTRNGDVLRYDSTVGEWMNDPFDGWTVSSLLPAARSVEYGVRYVTAGLPMVVDFSTPDTTHVRWKALDLGDKHLRKLWRRVEVFTNTEVDPNQTSIELMYWPEEAAGAVQGITTAEYRGGGRWVCTFPSGVVAATMDLELRFYGFVATDSVEPPVNITFVPRYRQR